jgi:hypothetical protein
LVHDDPALIAALQRCGVSTGGTFPTLPWLPEASNDEVAREASALGPADGALADAAGVRGGSGTRLGGSTPAG